MSSSAVCDAYCVWWDQLKVSPKLSTRKSTPISTLPCLIPSSSLHALSTSRGLGGMALIIAHAPLCGPQSTRPSFRDPCALGVGSSSAAGCRRRSSWRRSSRCCAGPPASWPSSAPSSTGTTPHPSPGSSRAGQPMSVCHTMSFDVL
jgi:hypothetical protein